MLKAGDAIRVDSVVDIVQDGLVHNVISENYDTPCNCRTFYGYSYAPNGKFNLVELRVQLLDESHMNVPFS